MGASEKRAAAYHGAVENNIVALCPVDGEQPQSFIRGPVTGSTFTGNVVQCPKCRRPVPLAESTVTPAPKSWFRAFRHQLRGS